MRFDQKYTRRVYPAFIHQKEWTKIKNIYFNLYNKRKFLKNPSDRLTCLRVIFFFFIFWTGDVFLRASCAIKLPLLEILYSRSLEFWREMIYCPQSREAFSSTQCSLSFSSVSQIHLHWIMKTAISDEPIFPQNLKTRF